MTFKKHLMKKLLIAIIIAATMLSSCARNGYGCHGRSKIITRVR